MQCPDKINYLELPSLDLAASKAFLVRYLAGVLSIMVRIIWHFLMRASKADFIAPLRWQHLRRAAVWWCCTAPI